MINRAPLERLSGEDKDTKLPSCEMTMTGENLEGTLRGRSRQKTPSRRKQKSLNHVSRGVVAEKARRFRSCSRRSSIISIGATSRLALALQEPNSKSRTSKQKRAMEQTDDDQQESEGGDTDVDAPLDLTGCEVGDSKSSCIPHSFLDATASHATAEATVLCTSALCGSSLPTDVGRTDGDGAPAAPDQQMKPESPQAQSVTPTTSGGNGAPAASSQQIKPESIISPQAQTVSPTASDHEDSALAALDQQEPESTPETQSERGETEPRTPQTKYRQCRKGVLRLNFRLQQIAKRRTNSENEKPVMRVELGRRIKVSEQTVANTRDWLLSIVRSMSKSLPLPDHIKNTLDGIETKMSSEPSPDRPPIDVVDESLVNLDQVLTELYRLYEWDECITEFVNLYEEFKPVPDGGGGASSLPALGTAPEMGVEQKKREEWLDRSLAAFMNYLVNGQNYALNLNPQLEKEIGLCKLHIDQGEPDLVTLGGALDDIKLCLKSLRQFIRRFKEEVQVVVEESIRFRNLKEEIGKNLAEHGVEEPPAVDEAPKIIGRKEYELWLQKSVRQFMNYLVAKKQAHIPLCDHTKLEYCTPMTTERIEQDLSAESPDLKHVDHYLVALEEMWLCQQEFDGFADKWRKLLTRSSGTDVAEQLKKIFDPETAERGPSVTRDVQSEVRKIMTHWMKSDADERLRPDESISKKELAVLLAAAADQDLYSEDFKNLLDWITRRIDEGLNDLGMPHRSLTETQ